MGKTEKRQKASGNFEQIQRRFLYCERRSASEGTGDLFGIRQSGELAFRIGDVFQDAAILQEANDAANDTLQDPSYPEGKDYAILRQNLEKYMYKDLCNLNL